MPHLPATAHHDLSARYEAELRFFRATSPEAFAAMDPPQEPLLVTLVVRPAETPR